VRNDGGFYNYSVLAERLEVTGHMASVVYAWDELNKHQNDITVVMLRRVCIYNYNNTLWDQKSHIYVHILYECDTLVSHLERRTGC
jgi:hypothetical protein